MVAAQIYMFVAPGLYRNERKAFLPYLIATPIFFSLGAMVVYFLVLPMLVRFSLGMQQTGSHDRCLDRADAESRRVSVPHDGADARLRGRVSATGHTDAAWPYWPDHGRAAQGQAALFYCRRLCSGRGTYAAGCHQPDVARSATAHLYEGSIWSVRLVEKKAQAEAAAKTAADAASATAKPAE